MIQIHCRGIGAATRLLCVAAALLGALFPRPVRADTLKTRLDPGLDGVVTIYYSGWGRSYSVYAGPFEATRNNWTTSFDAYCVDLDHWDNMPASYLVTPLSTSLLTTGTGGAANGPGIAWLYNTYEGGIHDATHGAALQLAIWELLTDGESKTGVGFATGNFRYTPTDPAHNPILLDAQGYLDGWYNHGSPYTGSALWFKADHDPDNDGDDDGVDQSLIGAAAPEPCSLALLAIGGLPLLTRLRRRPA